MEPASSSSLITSRSPLETRSGLINPERSAVAQLKPAKKRVDAPLKLHSGVRRSWTNGNQAPVDCAIRRARNKEAAQLPQSRIPVPIEAEIVIALD